MTTRAYQTRIAISIYEGEDENCCDNNVKISKLYIDIPSRPAGEVKLWVQFECNLDGELTVKAWNTNNPNDTYSVIIEDITKPFENKTVSSTIAQINSISNEKLPIQKLINEYITLSNNAYINEYNVNIKEIKILQNEIKEEFEKSQKELISLQNLLVKLQNYINPSDIDLSQINKEKENKKSNTKRKDEMEKIMEKEMDNTNEMEKRIEKENKKIKVNKKNNLKDNELVIVKNKKLKIKEMEKEKEKNTVKNDVIKKKTSKDENFDTINQNNFDFIQSNWNNCSKNKINDEESQMNKTNKSKKRSRKEYEQNENNIDQLQEKKRQKI